MAQYKNVEITLIENSSAGNLPKVFPAQTVEIHHEPDTVVKSVDGKISRGSHPSTILWYGGKASELQRITNVKILASDGAVLIDAQVNRFTDQPRDASRGVRFLVL